MSAESQKAVTPPAPPRKRTSGWIDTSAEHEDSRSFLILNAVPSWLASFLLNISLILILALFAYKTEIKNIVSLQASEVGAVDVEDISVNLEELATENADVLESSMSEAPSESFESAGGWEGASLADHGVPRRPRSSRPRDDPPPALLAAGRPSRVSAPAEEVLLRSFRAVAPTVERMIPNH